MTNNSEKERVDGSEGITWRHAYYGFLILMLCAICFMQGMNWELARENARSRKELRKEVDQLLIEAQKMDSAIKYQNQLKNK